MDSVAKWGHTRMPVSTIIVCPGSGCARHVFNSSVLTMCAKGLPNNELSRGHSTVILCI